MRKNDLIVVADTVYRVLDLNGDNALVIDCIKRTMPKWVAISEIGEYGSCSIEDLQEQTNINLYDFENAPKTIQRTAQ